MASFNGFCPTCGEKASSKQTTHPKDERNIDRWFWLCTNKHCDKGFIVWETKRPYDPEPKGTPYHQSFPSKYSKRDSNTSDSSSSSDSDSSSSSHHSRRKSHSHRRPKSDKPSKSKHKKHYPDYYPESKKRSHHKSKQNKTKPTKSYSSSSSSSSSESDSDSKKRKRKKKKSQPNPLDLILRATQENTRFLKSMIITNKTHYPPPPTAAITKKTPPIITPLPIAETTQPSVGPSISPQPSSPDIDIDDAALPLKTPPKSKTKKAPAKKPTPAKTKPRISHSQSNLTSQSLNDTIAARFNWSAQRIKETLRKKPLLHTKEEVLICRINKGLPYSRTCTSILKKRNTFLKKLKINRFPHPSKTHNIIYVMFNLSNQGPQVLYVGKTSNTAFQRRIQHIQKSNNPLSKTLPISKYIRKIGSHNLGILPLMSIPNYIKYSHYYERFWIHLFRSHIKPPSWFQSLNRSVEHAPFKHLHRSNHKTHSIHSNTSTSDLQPKLIAHPLIRTLTHLQNYPHINTRPPPILNHFSNHKLYKLLSILINKPTYFYPKPTYFQIQHHTTQLINIHHQTIVSLSTPAQNKKLALYISTQLDTNHKNLSRLPPKLQPNKLELLITEFTHPIFNQLNIPKLLHDNQTYLPSSINKTIQPKLIFKTNKPISHTLFNHKQALIDMKSPVIPIPPHTLCICTQPQFKPYLRSHGHIDTLDPTLIHCLTTSQNTAHKLITLIRKGSKYIETPNFQSRLLYLQIKKSLSLFIKQFKQNLPATAFKQWKQHILTSIKGKLSTQNTIYNNQPILTLQPIKNLIKTLHNDFIVTTPDKLTSNFSFSCKYWWYLELETSVIQASTTYKKSKKTPQQIIERHSKYLSHFNY
jgi:hypothetical protein